MSLAVYGVLPMASRGHDWIPIMTLTALIAAALACQTLPPSMLDIVIGNVLANENAALNERAVVPEPNGTYSYGIAMINTVNLDWTGLRGHEFEPCASLTAGAKVFLARYPGNPPDRIKAVYAARAMIQIAKMHLNPSTSPSPPPAAVTSGQVDNQPARPVRSALNLLATRR